MCSLELHECVHIPARGLICSCRGLLCWSSVICCSRSVAVRAPSEGQPTSLNAPTPACITQTACREPHLQPRQPLLLVQRDLLLHLVRHRH